MQAPENLLELIEKYQAGSATPQEKQLLQEWYHSFDDRNADINTAGELTEETLKERMLVRLSESIEKKKRPGIRKLLRRMPAAAIWLAILAAVYFLFLYKPAIQETTAEIPGKPPLENDIVPGGNRALLTLANGTTIILDSLQNGMIVQQENLKVEKLKNGLLSYTIVDQTNIADQKPAYHTITTPRGGQYQVTLSDGTRVWLNAASSIRFPVTFNGKHRSVEVTGETYFEVAKNPNMPFHVSAAGTEVEVLGTHFNLNAYNDEEEIRTTLIEGKVKVKSAGNKATSYLLPGQQSRIRNDGNIRVTENADIEEAIAWINGRFQFRSAGLKAILRQIARWYDVDVEYRGNVDMRFSGQLERSEQVISVLEKLKLTGEVNFRIEGRKIIVTGLNSK